MISHLNGKKQVKRVKIDRIEVAPDQLISRGGLPLFARYISAIGVLPDLQELFGHIRRSSKGQPVEEVFKQISCFFVDGTSPHLVYFDDLKRDEGYAASIESEFDDLLSSHAVKRFFSAFSWGLCGRFRGLLRRIFLWRLGIAKPKVIVLNVDTMVMDNDQAKKREGVGWTYKKVRGFQPLHMTWGPLLIDAAFRGGRKHGNNGKAVGQMVQRMVEAIRDEYGENIPIVIRVDAGFMDQKLFGRFERLGIGYTCSGKLYDDITDRVYSTDDSRWGRYEKGKQAWDYLELRDKRGTWDKSRRAFYTRHDSGELEPIESSDPVQSLIYTNLGVGGQIDEHLRNSGSEHLFEPSAIIELHHGRGRDELVHRALKDFGPEALPFKRFAPNTAFYYAMVLAFNLFECFKEDVLDGIVPKEAYPTTVRRRVIDIAAKIVRTGGDIILKVTKSVWNSLDLQTLWRRSGQPASLAHAFVLRL